MPGPHAASRPPIAPSLSTTAGNGALARGPVFGPPSPSCLVVHARSAPGNGRFELGERTAPSRELVVLDGDATIVVAQRESERSRLAHQLRTGSSFAGSGDQSSPGWMFLLLWNTFSGSYLALTSASRRYVLSP